MSRMKKAVIGTVAAALAVTAAFVPGVPGRPADRPAGAASTALRHLRAVDVRIDSLSVPTGTPEYVSSPALADLTGDDRPEVVVAAPNGTVTAFRVTDGTRLWQRDLGATAIQASPVVADVDLNGRVDVVAATMDGRVVLLNGQSGGVIRTYRQGAPLHCPPGVDCRPDGFFATPVVADVNRDGRMDIIAPSYDHTVYAWSVGGTLLWRSFLYDTLWSSPAVVDINRDGRVEVVVGGDIHAGSAVGAPAGGLLWALNGSNGSRFPGYPRSLPGQTVWSSPAITDLDGDGRWDVVVGTGANGPFGTGTNGRKVWAFTLATRRDLPGWPVTPPGRVIHQPAVGDIDGNDGGRPEVVVASEGGYVTAYNHTGGSSKWATCNYSTTTTCAANLATHGGAVIADTDNDGVQEVVSALTQRMRVYDGRDRGLESDVRLTGGNGILNPASIAAVSEINGNTLVAQSYLYRDGHGGPARSGDIIRTDLYTTDEPLCAEDWPAFKRSPRRDSVRAPRPPWHPFRCGRPFVVQQYRDLLGRTPDAAGQTYWTARLRSTWSGPRVVEGFMNSPEFGAVAAPVVRLHLGLRGGPPLPSGTIRNQMASLRGGATLTDVAEDMVDDPPWSGQTDTQFVDLAFTRLMGRGPTASERAAALADVADDGRGAWIARLANSAWPVGYLQGRVQVAMTYIGLLDRGPDEEGWDFWVGQADDGIRPQRLIELFLASAEYANRVL